MSLEFNPLRLSTPPLEPRGSHTLLCGSRLCLALSSNMFLGLHPCGYPLASEMVLKPRFSQLSAQLPAKLQITSKSVALSGVFPEQTGSISRVSFLKNLGQVSGARLEETMGKLHPRAQPRLSSKSPHGSAGPASVPNMPGISF